MKILGIIPARGGSKGIPNKNIVPLGGRPLLAYTCEAALLSKSLTRVILSTDDETIAAAGRACGVEVPFLRPSDLAQDGTTSLPVIQHALHWLATHDDYEADVAVLLQPTSPLRRTEHIDAAIELLLESGADVVVSVVEVPHQYHPASLMRMDEAGHLTPFMPGSVITRRQDKPRVYARNGPAIYAARTTTLLKADSLYAGECRPLVMGLEESLDVDTWEDLRSAEFFINQSLTPK